MKIGEVVCSKAGRDKNKYFIVTKIIDELFIEICDGKLRKLDKPKRKKIKHLKGTDVIIESLSDRIVTDQKVTNSDLRRAISEYETQVEMLLNEND